MSDLALFVQTNKSMIIASAATVAVISVFLQRQRNKPKPEAVKKNEKTPILITGLFQKNTFPNGSPFVAKLDAVFRANNFKVISEGSPNVPCSKTGKVPALYYKGETISDSELIVNRLVSDGAISEHPNAWLVDPVTRANAEMFRLAVENFIYYRLGNERWIHHCEDTLECYFGGLTGFFKVFVQQFVKLVIKKGQIEAFSKMRYSEDTWVQMETVFWDNAAALLGEKQYFFSNSKMCMADYTAFGLLANVVELPNLTPRLYQAVARHQNLLDFVARVKKELYPEQP
ncbi:hypothetical protein BDR26DRAFT_548240 [Obelidium mucronatum]|nr:hypothetical protein BDR26DRAFT_548240 [Obelidium mucronatum]